MVINLYSFSIYSLLSYKAKVIWNTNFSINAFIYFLNSLRKKKKKKKI